VLTKKLLSSMIDSDSINKLSNFLARVSGQSANLRPPATEELAMIPPDDSARLPGVVRQFGYVVTDLDQAVASWLSVGVGPWYLMRGIPQRALYRGQPCDVTLSGRLRQQRRHADRTHPASRRHSQQSIRSSSRRTGAPSISWPGGPKTSTRHCSLPRMPVGLSCGTDAEAGAVRYAYLEPPAGPAAIVEIMELNELSGGMASLVKGAAAGWDGSDPIRSLAG